MAKIPDFRLQEEYQRLYDEQVLPKQSNTEFSSDDDTEEVSPPPRPPSVAKNTKHDSKTQVGNELNLFGRTQFVCYLIFIFWGVFL